MLRAGVFFILFISFLPNWSSAQFNDDFTDGNFTNDPVWSGDDALFVVVDDAGNNRLRSNSSGAATYHLSTPSTQAANALWEFFIDLRFATSGANYVDVYLISPQANLNPRPDGYFVRIGDTQDHIVLYRRQGSTNTALISSPAGTVGSSSSNPFRIRVTRDASDNWTLFYHPGETGTFLVAGTAVDATFNTSTHFGILIVQSTAASVVNNHFFDDFVVSDIPVDEDPPQLLSATVIDANTVDLVFNEALSATTAENVANYSADNGLGQPISAAMQSASVVRLTFTAGFVSGTNYTVTVNGVQDLAGNAITNASTNFLYFVPDDPAWREVVLNELMADPTPSQGLPESEYIELFNATTDKFFDLTGWKITTNTTQATLPAYALAPGEFVVLVNNNNLPLFSFIENIVGITLSSTALVNGGTTVSLLDATDELLDRVSYNTGWYGDASVSDGGWSLEQIDPFRPCSGANNWSASAASDGGTPGAQNAIFDPTPDTTAPELIGASLIGTSEVILFFNEPMDQVSLMAAEVSIVPDLTVTGVTPVEGSDLSISVTFQPEAVAGVVYTVTVSGVSDCVGNMIGSNNSAAFFIPDTPEYRDVVINELMVDENPSQGLPLSEYIELFNATNDKYFDLAGWRITTNATQTTLPPYALAPGEYVVFVNTNNHPLFDLIPNSAPFSLSASALLNTGTTVTLLDNTENTIDRVAYTIDWYNDPDRDGGGWSLEQINPFSPCSGAHNWSASDAALGGTPGTQNSIYDPTPDTAAPQLITALVADTFVIELVFNEPMDTESLLAGSYSISPDLGISEIQLVITDDRRVRLTVDQAPVIGVFYTVTVSGVSDCIGNAITTNNTAIFAVPEPAAALDIIINEVMYDPATGSNEFVELYNNSQKVIDLAGMYIGRALDDLSNRRVITTTPWILLPDEYVVLTSNISNVVEYYPQSLTDRFIQMSLPSLPNSGGTVSVLNAELELIDHFEYASNMHFTLVSNSKGFSLERVDPDRPTQDATNWQTASEPAGRATPGFQNSQYAPAPVATGAMTIDPAIFSPDNDGYQDVLTITYEFQQDGFIGTMLIFDVAGREVKRLMDNKILGTSGSISWDGILDNGSKGRIGPYIVMLEAFDIDGNVERFKKTVTLAHFLD